MEYAPAMPWDLLGPMPSPGRGTATSGTALQDPRWVFRPLTVSCQPSALYPKDVPQVMHLTCPKKVHEGAPVLPFPFPDSQIFHHLAPPSPVLP